MFVCVARFETGHDMLKENALLLKQHFQTTNSRVLCSYSLPSECSGQRSAVQVGSSRGQALCAAEPGGGLRRRGPDLRVRDSPRPAGAEPVWAGTGHRCQHGGCCVLRYIYIYVPLVVSWSRLNQSGAVQ